MYYIELYWYPGEGEEHKYETWEEVLLFLNNFDGDPPDGVSVGLNPNFRNVPASEPVDIPSVLRQLDRPRPLKSRSMRPLDLNMVPSMDEVFEVSDDG